jgi:hypothetical protein
VGIAERFPSLALFGDGRKWHFGKHVNSLTGLWGPSYWPQFGMSKCHLRLAQYGDSFTTVRLNLEQNQLVRVACCI